MRRPGTVRGWSTPASTTMVTSSAPQGVTSGLDLARWLVERYVGAALAAAVAHQIESVRHGPIWQAAGEASPRAWATRPETTKTAR